MSFPDNGGRSAKRVAGKIICTYVKCLVRARSCFSNKKYLVLGLINKCRILVFVPCFCWFMIQISVVLGV